MALAKQAHIALPEQPALEEARLQVRQEADHQVHAPRFHLVAQRVGRLRTVLTVTPGASLANRRISVGKKYQVASIYV
ncbi:hypothetical protein ACEQUB_01042 [Ralstonia syzygii]